MATHIQAECVCGRRLKARAEFAGTRAPCPTCGRTVQIPEGSSEPVDAEVVAPGESSSHAQRASMAMEVKEFFDPPKSAPPAPEEAGPPVWRRMFEALLDPRSIQWMLFFGGGLAVLGLIIWLVALGIFEEPWVVAVFLGLGTLAILSSGWCVVLKTKYRTAGQALTFLGCVVAPLNLWFYDAHNLITLDQQLWIGGVVCSLLYVATLYVLRDPLFIYAVQGGVTLTVLLLLAELGLATDPTALSLIFLSLGLIALHGERAFPPEAPEFSRQRYGLPLFWSGHVQLGVGLFILLGYQVLGFFQPITQWLDYLPEGQLLVENYLLGGVLWVIGVYAYLYSDLVVRRIGVYTSLAAVCLMMAVVSLLQLIPIPEKEALVAATLAATALGVNLVHRFLAQPGEKLNRIVPPIGLILSAVPLSIGWVFHLRATSTPLGELWAYDTGWPFVMAMLVVAGCNRTSAWAFRDEGPRLSAAYLFFAAAGAILATAGLLRIELIDLTGWYQQAPLLMLIPILYILAARVWRGQPEERPLEWVSHTAAAVILAHGLFGWVDLGDVFRPMTGQTENLLLGLVFAEAALFYALAGVFCRRGVNAYLAAAAACGALWQWLGYFEIDPIWYTMLYALLGVAGLFIARSLGLEQVPIYRAKRAQGTTVRGRGLTVFQCGNAILSVALLSAFFMGLADLATRGGGEPTLWLRVCTLFLTTVASAMAIGLVPGGMWRRWYTTATIALAALTFLTLTIGWLVQLTLWQKLQLFSLVVGIGLLIASHVGRFRETDAKVNDMVSFGLLLGSLLAALPLLIAVFYYRWIDGEVSRVNELGLLTATILMLLTGGSWRIRATTYVGGASLVVYLVLVILAGLQEAAVGIQLALGGTVVFALGIALSVYRDRLLELPDRIARREGIFRIMTWR